MSRRAGLTGAALALLALAVVRGSGGGPPLYDGICLPPHYLSLGASPGPKSVSETFTAAELAQTFELADDPNTPQAQLIVTALALAPATGNSTVTVSIAPVQSPAVKPPDGTVDGNVYDFEARSSGQSVQLAAGKLAAIVLGATSTGGPQIAIEHFDGTRWTPVAKTVQSGCGTTYQANTPTLGLFALVAQGQTPATGGAAPPSGGSPTILVIVLILAVIAVLVFVILIVAVRISRHRGRRGRRRR
ncbi:MAG: hypothetical protein JF886_12365 [Candidatus Dormibacteraeota bacterium]|uniref:Uncharacterized protein n=1 Tax=Candidatus Aeolococcus gillhamiae TaxID=3127015 RepID=A0A2W5ZEU7_9BACT|nr:hypothetical protein [Candidatus Dormibacteraeota bacterium]PZR81316.1 MAG: hypothetical protein DLM65_05980 [Candidatus Dormibacter sp. RRmetagenome_bin12]